MAAETTAVRRRMWSFAVSESLRRAALGYHSSIIYRPRYSGPAPDRLLIAPTDLRTSDATLAHDIYAGRFVFAGTVVEADGTPVFAVDPPNEDWARELHGFGWLRHLRASELMVSRSNARSLVSDWIRLGNGNHPISREPDVVARRMLSWLSQSPLVLEGCDHAFYRKYIRSLTTQIRGLRRIAPNGPPGLPRLTMMMALAAAAVALPDQDRFLRQAGRWLDAELNEQILPDGGHISRSPVAVLDILADLLPLRQAFAARGLQPPPGMISAIDRMMPMVRFFRHGDGTFARFNGTGDTPIDLIATVLAYDDARGTPVTSAPHSGFERMAHGDTVVVYDTGRPAPIALTGEAHAGALSFELSSGPHRIIVNCGTGRSNGTRLHRLSRTTAAHSTVSVNDCSSCRFLMGSALARRFGEVIVEGPQLTTVARAADEDGSNVMIASHDGYVERFGLIHERRVKLSPSGHRLDGIDRLLAAPGGRLSRGAKDEYAIRFHLHPDVVVRAGERGQALLTLPNGEAWQFATEQEISLEESLFFSETYGNLWSTQIVVSGRPQAKDTVAWWLQRTGLPTRHRGDA
jgi:uncharacterized heparinase superfamily protein